MNDRDINQHARNNANDLMFDCLMFENGWNFIPNFYKKNFEKHYYE